MNMNNVNKRYAIPEQDDATMAQESIALRYNSIETLKLQCLEKVIPYTIEELQQRCDEATAELEAGGGMDGDTFFKELKEHIRYC